MQASHPGPGVVSRNGSDQWPAAPDGRPSPRATVRGKFFFEGRRKLYLKGVTYGPFGEAGAPEEFGHPLRVERDFTVMRRHGINTIRTYGIPPLWFLDTAARRGLRVFAGLAWEQHVAFLDEPGLAERIHERAAREVAAVRGHPAIAAYAVGNEIPAPIVRWHGRSRTEAFLEGLSRIVRREDPGVPVTYVNYPTTEYLELPSVDFLSFNVYLEEPEELRAYIARLQNLAGDRPLVMAELGLDAGAHGELAQARAVEWQLRAAFQGGCAGALVFAWTDQWFRGGREVEDWSFGMTARDRTPKPALHAASRAFRAVPHPPDEPHPRISVVICTYNGAGTLDECLRHVKALRYPDYEVIVVDDGSTDDTAQVASRYDVRLITTPNRGLSSARNTGLQAATGHIVAYLDDDAFPDRDWLGYLAQSFRDTDHAGVGGPNVPPDDDGLVARCVARSPGGPIHVLLSDTEAEHLPGCNMAFRADRLRAIGGFDPRFRAAGDDVDVCWRLMDGGYTLGFNPGAVVWHRRRSSVKGFWKQQLGYGRAEALLERKWPEKYNATGHHSWAGRLYGGSAWTLLPRGRERIYQGTWGTAPFQTREAGPPGALAVAALLPEAWLTLLALVLVALLGVWWTPLFAAAPVAVALAGALSGHLLAGAWRASRVDQARGRRARTEAFLLTSLLHLIQPLARLTGRMSRGLAPGRRYVPSPLRLRRLRTFSLWSERWRSQEAWLRSVERGLRARGIVTRRGGEYNRWDLEARSGSLASLRILMTVEEHGGGRQLLRFRVRPRWERAVVAISGGGLVLALGAGFEGAWGAALALLAGALALVARTVQEHTASADAVEAAAEAALSGERPGLLSPRVASRDGARTFGPRSLPEVGLRTGRVGMGPLHLPERHP